VADAHGDGPQSQLIATIVHDLLVKRTKVTRFLFGMKLKKKPVEAPAQRAEDTVS
jgi:hypothetical protein